MGNEPATKEVDIMPGPSITPPVTDAPAINAPGSDVISDSADTSPRGPAADTSGKRVRAIPYQNENRIELSANDFKTLGVKHKAVRFDQRVNHFTLAVGDGDGELSAEAAEKLTKLHGHAFEFMDS